MATERRLGPRFGPEAGLILAAAAFAALLELSWPGVIAVVLSAWLAVAIFEIVRAHVGPFFTEEEPRSPRPEPGPQLEPTDPVGFAAPPSAHVEPPAGPEPARGPSHAPEPRPESSDEHPASLVAAPARDEPLRPLEPDSQPAPTEREQRS